MKKPRYKYTDFSIPVKICSAKLCFSTYNKNKKKVSEKDTFFFVMLPVHYPFLFLNHLWSSQLSLFEKPSYRNK